MKKVMICQPMLGKSEGEIIATRDKAAKLLENRGYEVVNTFFVDEWYSQDNMEGVVEPPLYFLAKSLEKMSYCDAVYFCKGWEDARGCRIEHEVALSYGYTIIYERRGE